MHELSHHLVKTDQVIGVNVINTNHENLGKVEELVLDKQTGETVYAVLSFGGVMGLGDKYFAIPWKALSYDPKEASFTLNQSKEALKEAPGFDKQNWPNMADRTWQQNINTFYEDDLI
jgi:sporulation protein YlmC with PRC-barrel domain